MRWKALLALAAAIPRQLCDVAQRGYHIVETGASECGRTARIWRDSLRAAEPLQVQFGQCEPGIETVRRMVEAALGIPARLPYQLDVGCF